MNTKNIFCTIFNSFNYLIDKNEFEYERNIFYRLNADIIFTVIIFLNTSTLE